MRKLFFVLFSLLILTVNAGAGYGQNYIPLAAPSAILAEQSTGKILYGKNEQQRMYPASMTKILTALVAMDWLNPDDIITVGTEIYGLPADYAGNTHFDGETITVRNVLRALMIQSCNESGNVLALNTIRAKENVQDISYQQAEVRFLQLMNEKAVELGALNSNFNNTYGNHSPYHYTTAEDMAIISRAYMENDLLRELANERMYVGDSLEGREVENANVNQYEWQSHNELLLGGENGYLYANGIKTGFHDDAGDCVAASATRDGVTLIAVVFNSEDPGRWQDSKLLFDYGFETFGDRIFKTDGEILDTVTVSDTRLGETDKLDIFTKGNASAYLSEDELERITREVVYDPLYIAPEKTEDGEEQLITPIEIGMPLGTVTYMLDGEILFQGPAYAGAELPARNFDSDMDYYIEEFKSEIFTIKGFPYWFGAVGFLVGIIGIIAAVIAGRKNKKERYRGGYYKPYKGRRM